MQHEEWDIEVDFNSSKDRAKANRSKKKILVGSRKLDPLVVGTDMMVRRVREEIKEDEECGEVNTLVKGGIWVGGGKIPQWAIDKGIREK